jgi:hypothetical protein
LDDVEFAPPLAFLLQEFACYHGIHLVARTDSVDCQVLELSAKQRRRNAVSSLLHKGAVLAYWSQRIVGRFTVLKCSRAIHK